MICGLQYVHIPDLAPSQEMLDAYKKQAGDWQTYENEFRALIQARQVESHVDKETISESCLLCSEDKPDHCHRRLVGEYLCDKWGDVDIIHL